MDRLLKDQKFRDFIVSGGIALLVVLLWKPSFAPSVFAFTVATLLLFWANNYALYTARHQALLGSGISFTLGLILVVFGNARQNDLNKLNNFGSQTREYCALRKDPNQCLGKSRALRAEIIAIAQGKYRGQLLATSKELALLSNKRDATVSSALIPVKSSFYSRMSVSIAVTNYEQIRASIDKLGYDLPNMQWADLSLSDSFAIIIYTPVRPVDFYFSNVRKIADIDGVAYYTGEGNRQTNFIIYSMPDKSRLIATTPKLMQLTQIDKYISIMEAQRNR